MKWAIASCYTDESTLTVFLVPQCKRTTGHRKWLEHPYVTDMCTITRRAGRIQPDEPLTDAAPAQALHIFIISNQPGRDKFTLHFDASRLRQAVLDDFAPGHRIIRDVIPDALPKLYILRPQPAPKLPRQQHEIRGDRVRHPRYRKTLQRTKRLYAHDETNDVREGDRVRVAETRRTSKQKRWRVVEVLERAR